MTGRAFVDRKPVHVPDLTELADEFPAGHAMALLHSPFSTAQLQEEPPTFYPSTLRTRAEKIIAESKGSPLRIAIGQGKSQLGGGTLPRSTIPSVTLDITPDGPVADFAARLRSASPPIIGYISAGKYKLDLRTVFAGQDAQIIQALRN